MYGAPTNSGDGKDFRREIERACRFTEGTHTPENAVVNTKSGVKRSRAVAARSGPIACKYADGQEVASWAIRTLDSMQGIVDLSQLKSDTSINEKMGKQQRQQRVMRVGKWLVGNPTCTKTTQSSKKIEKDIIVWKKDVGLG